MSGKGKGKATEHTRTPLTNDEILAKVQSERVLIPAISALYNSYPQKDKQRYRIKQHRKTVQPLFNNMLKRIVPKPEDREDLENIDFVLMTSSLFPAAELREYTTLLYLSTWLFLLGGQLRLLSPKQTDYLSATDNQPGWVAGARANPKKVSTFVERGLGIDPEQAGPMEVLQHNAITEIFEERICGELREGCYGAQLALFIEQLEYFMAQAQKEMDLMAKLTVPTMDEYRAIRMAVPAGVGGVSVLLSLVQYASRFRVHRKITDVPPVKKLWDETLSIVWLTIDLHTYKLKEDHELFLNAVIVYLKETGCARVQTAVDEVFGLLREAISKFEQLAVELMEQRGEHSMSKDEATIIVEGFRGIFVGNHRWMTQAVASMASAALAASTASETAITADSGSD